MKNKIITTTLIATLIISIISGCGDSPQESATSVAQSEETPTETSSEILKTGTETSNTETEDTPETATVDESAQEQDLSDNTEQEVNEQFTVEDGMQKLALLFNARNDLYKTDDLAIYNMLLGAENYNMGNQGLEMNVSTSDGIPLYISSDDDEETRVHINDIRIAVIANYWYNYVNVDQQYYDLYDYVKSHTSDEILHGNHEYSLLCGADDTNNITMQSVAPAIEYLFENIDHLTPGDMISGDDCMIEIVGEDVEYEIPILIDNEYIGARLIFDADRNLLNIAIFPEDGWKDEYYIDSEDTGWIVAQ